MRKQYHFQPSEKGYFAWDVDRLVQKSNALPVIDIPLEEVKELDEPFWYGGESDIPTCRSVATHAKLIMETDLDYPIILASDGRVMDGMHRVCKALLKNHKIIKAVRFKKTPPPDYENVLPEELPY